MTEKKPTEEQIKEFWKWCGLKWMWNHNSECTCGAKDDDDSRRSWHYCKDGEWKLATPHWYEDLPIDLNNLFKYAVPKLYLYLSGRGEYLKFKFIFNILETEIIRGATIEEQANKLCLFIWEVIHGK